MRPLDHLVPWHRRIEHVADIGVVFGHRLQLGWDLPVIGSSELLRDIYPVSEHAYRQCRDELVERLTLVSL